MRLHWKLMITYAVVVVLVLLSADLYLSSALRGFVVGHLGDRLSRESRLAAELWRDDVEGARLDAERSRKAAGGITINLERDEVVLDGGEFNGDALAVDDVAAADETGIETSQGKVRDARDAEASEQANVKEAVVKLRLGR